MPLIPFLDRYYRRENNNGVGLGRKKIAKLATLKSNWEALDWRELGYSVHLCSATNHYKSQGTKKEQKLSGEKNGSDLGVHNSDPFLFICGHARLFTAF